MTLVEVLFCFQLQVFNVYLICGEPAVAQFSFCWSSRIF